jgi:hypothetical protein
MKSILKTLVDSNFFVALVLGSLTASTYANFHELSWKWYVPASIFLSSFILYSFHRLYKIDFIPKDQLAERHLWMLKNAIKVKYAMVFAVFLMMLLLPNFSADTIVWLVPASIVSIGYTIPILPTKDGWQRFRDIPLTKPLIIALVVSYLTLAFPLFEQEGIYVLSNKLNIAALFERCCFLIAVTIPFEIRDVRSDNMAGLSTMATRLGFIESKKTSLAATFTWLVLLALLCLEAQSLNLFLVQLIFVGGPLVIAVWKMKPGWNEHQYALIFEGLILLYATTRLLVGFLI